MPVRAPILSTCLPAGIGLPSQLYAHLELSAALRLLAPCARLVEVFSAGRHTLLCASNRQAARDSGLAFTVHGPFGEGLDPGDVCESRRRLLVEEHRRHAEAAAEIHALCYVVHPDRRSRAGPPAAAVHAALERTLADLERVQRETGVRIAVENQPRHAGTHFAGPGDLDLGELGLALDCGHAAISSTLQGFLEDPRAELVHVHLHSNHGSGEQGDPHRALGEGVVDAAPVLRLAKAAGATVILEHDDAQAVRASVAHLMSRGLLDDRLGDAAGSGASPLSN